MRSFTRTGLIVALAATAMLAGSSCSEYRANTSTKKASELLAEMRNNLNGNEHAADALTRIEQEIAKANQEVSSGNAAAALATAKGALQLAEQTRAQVLNAEALKKFEQATTEINVGRSNGVDRTDQQRFGTVLELLAKAEAAKAKNDYEEVIKQTGQIMTEMKTLLFDLEQKTNRAQIDANQRLTDLKTEGGQDYAPEVVIAVQEMISSATTLATKDREYNTAKLKFDEARAAAETGIELVKKARSREELEAIDTLLATALVEGAKTYKLDDYNSVVKQHEALNADYASGRYDRVMQGSQIVKPKAEQLVVDTKRAAADARIKEIDDNIVELTDGGARQYLPGRTEELDALLVRAQEIRRGDTEKDFDDIKALSVQAIDVYEKIKDAFNELALDAIRKSSGSIDTTIAVYTQVANIFDPISGEMTPDQRAFEAQKETRRVQLGQQIENCRKDLQEAFLNQKEGRFRAAIVLAEDIQGRAEAALGEVYHVVGHNAAIELANLVSRYERDGAREYAPDELARSTKELDEVKGLIAGTQYQAAVNRAAEARANVELMAQRIAGRATVNIANAREALRNAGTDRTRKYRSAMLDQVRTLIEEAETDLRNASLKLAVEKADSATQMANQAQREAFMQSARESIDRSKAAIARAQTAGAELYAGRETQDSKSLLASAESLFAGEDFEKAEQLSESAYERASQALYRKVLDAETEIASARAVGGWELDSDTLGRAGARAREARSAIDGNDFDRSGTLADEARNLAEGVTVRAKNDSFKKTVARIETNLDKGTQQGINFFQPEDSIAIRRRLTELQNGYSVARYDMTMADLAKLEGGLRNVLDSTDDTLFAVAAQQENRLNKLVEAGAVAYAESLVDDARNNLNYARLDYRRDLYKSAHSALSRAISAIDQIEMRGMKESYSFKAADLMERYREQQRLFGKVLELDAGQLKAIALSNGASRAMSVSTRTTPSAFRDAMDRIYSESLELAPPKGFEKVNQQLLEALNQGRMASIQFEKMSAFDVLSEGEVARTIDDAYMHINASNALLSTVQQQLADTELRFRLAQSTLGGGPAR